MLLAVDIGNTNISFALMKGQQIVHKFVVTPETRIKTQALIFKELRKIQKKYSPVSKALICSVVPSLTALVKKGIKQGLALDPKVIGENIQVPIENNYRKPQEVGQDRLLGSFAAKQIYGYPAIIIDLGTAITFDVVSAEGKYEGGLIVPGIRLSMESLSHETALLPHVEDVKSPKQIIGKSTQESILSGVFNGYGAMCCGLIDQLSAEFSRKPKVIVTGGHTRLMKKYIASKITTIDTALIFKGIYLLQKSAK